MKKQSKWRARLRQYEAALAKFAEPKVRQLMQDNPFGDLTYNTIEVAEPEMYVALVCWFKSQSPYGNESAESLLYINGKRIVCPELYP